MSKNLGLNNVRTHADCHAALVLDGSSRHTFLQGHYFLAGDLKLGAQRFLNQIFQAWALRSERSHEIGRIRLFVHNLNMHLIDKMYFFGLVLIGMVNTPFGKATRSTSYWRNTHYVLLGHRNLDSDALSCSLHSKLNLENIRFKRNLWRLEFESKFRIHLSQKWCWDLPWQSVHC